MSWTVLPQQQPKPQSALSSLIGGLAAGAPQALQALLGQKQQREEDTALEAQGIPVKGIKNPEIRKALLESHYKTKAAQAESDRKEALAKAAAKEAGYTYGAPPAVAAEQLKAKAKNDRLKSYGLGNREATGSNQPQGNEPSTPQNQGNSFFRDKTDDELVALQGAPDREIAEPAKGEAKRREVEQKKNLAETKLEHEKFVDERDFHTKISRPIIEAAQQRLKSSTIERGLTQQLRRDIGSGNTSGLFNFMVDKMGLEAWRNPESARFTNEVKNRFTGSLKDIPGARPNQFIERFLSTAQPLIGRSPEANLSVLDVDDFVNDVKDEHARNELKLAKEDKEKFGYAKDDISQRAWEAMGDYANRRQEKMAIDVRKRHEEGKEVGDLMLEVLRGEVPPDTPLTPKMARIFFIKNDNNETKAIAEAKKAGFVLPEYLE
jgi:hypothetical protein